jgi:hypothetical protein
LNTFRQYCRIWVSLVSTFAILSACNSGGHPAFTPVAPQIAVWIGDKPITAEELQVALSIFLLERGLAQAQSLEEHERIVKDCINDMAESYVLRKEAQKRGITDETSNLEIAGMVDEDSEFPTGFEELEKNRKAWQQRVKERMVLMETASIIGQELANDLQTDESEIEGAYDREKDDFKVPMELDVRVIRSVDKSLIDDVWKKLKVGWSFIKLAEQYSNVRGKGAKGEVFREPITDFPLEFQPELTQLAKGKFSSILTFEEEYYVYLIEGRTPEHVLPLTAIRDTLVSELQSRERSHRYREWMKQKVAELDIHIGTPIPYPGAKE